jgi:serine/threonine protein kinase
MFMPPQELIEPLHNPSSQQQRQHAAACPNELTVDDFEQLNVLGKGSYGKVVLVRKRGANRTQGLFAMKTLCKEELAKRGQLQHVDTERRIAEELRHPFIVGLCFTFQCSAKIYLVLDYMEGGELLFWLQKHQRFSKGGAFSCFVCWAWYWKGGISSN